MRAMGFTNRWKQAAGATFGFAALAFTFACNTAPQATSALAQQPQINQAGAPVMVNCEPQQRAVVRPTVVNGVAMSQVDCVAAAPLAAAPPAQPVAVCPADCLHPAGGVSRAGDAIRAAGFE